MINKSKSRLGFNALTALETRHVFDGALATQVTEAISSTSPVVIDPILIIEPPIYIIDPPIDIWIDPPPYSESVYAGDDAFTGKEDNTVTGNVSGNDWAEGGSEAHFWLPGEMLAHAVETQAAHGTVTMQADGTFTYVPNKNFNGTDTFTYKVNGMSDGYSAIGTVTITLDAVNDRQVVKNDYAYTTRGAAVNVNVLANDTDVDGDKLKVTKAVSQKGTVTIGADGTLTYTPKTGYTGRDIVNYTTIDAGGETVKGKVMIEVGRKPVTATTLAADYAKNIGDKLTTLKSTNSTLSSLNVDSIVSKLPTIAKTYDTSIQSVIDKVLPTGTGQINITNLDTVTKDVLSLTNSISTDLNLTTAQTDTFKSLWEKALAAAKAKAKTAA